MRGVYTTGVLDFFMEKDLWFKECYAVSAGAGHACSYLARQKGRALSVNIDYLNDKRYAGIYSFLKTGDLFGMDFIYNEIPQKLYPIDYQAFRQNPSVLYAVVTNCKTGQAEYIPIKDLAKDMIYVRASGSLPMLAHIVKMNGKEYLDGGVADSIPIRKSVENGNRKNVLVLTQCKTYRKGKSRHLGLIRYKYRAYPKLVAQIESRHERYNETLAYIDRLEESGQAIVIRPQKPVEVARTEKNKEKLLQLYRDGYRDAQQQYGKIVDFLCRQ